MPLTLDGTKGETFPSWNTAGRPASPNTGQTGYNTDGAELETWNGTVWVPMSGLNAMSAATTTSGASVDFTGIPAWVKKVSVIFNGTGTTGNNYYLIQLGYSGGIEATGYLGACSLMPGGGGGCSTVNPTTGFGIYCGNSTYLLQGIVTLMNISGNTWVASGICSTSSTTATFSTGGNKTISGGVLDRVRITFSAADTFRAGSINVVYEG